MLFLQSLVAWRFVLNRKQKNQERSFKIRAGQVDVYITFFCPSSMALSIIKSKQLLNVCLVSLSDLSGSTKA